MQVNILRHCERKRGFEPGFSKSGGGEISDGNALVLIIIIIIRIIHIIIIIIAALVLLLSG